MWSFRKLGKREMNIDSGIIELFVTRSETDIAESLVREVIQNTLDANAESKNSDKPALIKFNYVSNIDKNFAEEINIIK